METKTVEVNREVYKRMLVDQVIPAIKSKMPNAARPLALWLQQDNARPHRINDDPEVRQEKA